MNYFGIVIQLYRCWLISSNMCIFLSCLILSIYQQWATSMIGPKQSHEQDSIFIFHAVFHSHSCQRDSDTWWTRWFQICFTQKNTNSWIGMAGYWSNRLYEVLFAGCIPATWSRISFSDRMAARKLAKQCCRRKREAFPFLLFFDIMKIVVDKDLVVYICLLLYLFFGGGGGRLLPNCAISCCWGFLRWERECREYNPGYVTLAA